jgi:hypothetical protein
MAPRRGRQRDDRAIGRVAGTSLFEFQPVSGRDARVFADSPTVGGGSGTNSKNPNPFQVGASVRRQSASPLIIVSVSRLSFKSYLLPSEA